MNTPPKRPSPVHPGEVLREEFLKPLAISPAELARRLNVPGPRINDIVLEKRGISANTALRLARFFGTSARFWMRLQTAHDLAVGEERLGDTLATIRPLATT